MSEVSKQRRVAVFVAEAATPSDLDAIRTWASKLLEIRSNPMSKLAKAQAAVSLTASSKVVWPVAKMVQKRPSGSAGMIAARPLVLAWAVLRSARQYSVARAQA